MAESLSDFDRRTAEVNGLRASNLKLQQELRAAKDRQANLVDAVLRAAFDAQLALGPIVVPLRPKYTKGSGAEEVALAHLTDWQGSKVTTSYNTEVMKERVMTFARRMVKITEVQRADHPVRVAHLMFGGDMIEGLFNFPTQPFEIDQTIFGQYVTVARLIIDLIVFLLASFDEVHVTAEWGNHGRMGSKRDAVPRSDNLVRMTYELARQMLGDNSRVIWSEHGEEDIQRVEVGNYRALLIHGDEVGRGGFASPMQIVAHCNRWKAGAYPWSFQDVYVGHYHTHMELSLADGVGAAFWTGSIESDNRYARETMAASAQPSQRLHFVHPERALVTAQYKVFVS